MPDMLACHAVMPLTCLPVTPAMLPYRCHATVVYCGGIVYQCDATLVTAGHCGATVVYCGRCGATVVVTVVVIVVTNAVPRLCYWGLCFCGAR